MSALAVMALSATAQDFDNTPTLNINNKEKQVKFTVGARFMADAAYYNTEATPLKSGATISDARIRTSMSYGGGISMLTSASAAASSLRKTSSCSMQTRLTRNTRCESWLLQ